MLLKVLFFAILLWLIFRAARNLLVAATGGMPARREKMESMQSPSRQRDDFRAHAESRTTRVGKTGSRKGDIEDAVWEDLP